MICVVGGNSYAIAYTTIALLIHHRFVLEKNSEWQLVAIVTLVGSLWDFLMVRIEVFYYPDAGFLGIPIWLIACGRCSRQPLCMCSPG